MNIPTLISRIFEPMLLWTAVTAIGAWRSGMENFQFIKFMLVLVLLMFLPVIAFLFYAIRTRIVSDWDLSRREQRVKILKPLCILIFVYLGIVWLFGNTLLFNLFIFYAVWFSGFYAITLFWKISGHTGTLTLVICLLTGWFGSWLWPLFFAVPLLIWARVKGRKHTLAQAVGGVVYSLTVYLISKKIFNF